MMKRLVFIDRDGVINVDLIGDYIKTWEQFKFEKGALEAMKKMSDAGLELVIISNQAGIGDGVYPESALWDIHGKMMEEFKRRGIQVSGAFYCLHGKEAGCKCRKPETGLFEQAVEGKVFDHLNTYFIGDKATDVEAGKRFGIKTVFVRTGHGRLDEPKLTGRLAPDYRADDLAGAAEIVTR